MRRAPKASSAVTRGVTPLLLAAVSALIVLPTTILVTFALVPSLAALVVDEGRPRYLFRTVLSMNLAALWPYLERLWLNGNGLNEAVAIVGDLYTWAAVYGSAGIGWLAYLSAPGVVAAWRRFNAQREVEALKARQRALAEEWGAALPAGPEAASPAAAGEAAEASG